MIVADTSVLIHLYVPGPRSGIAERAWRLDPEWHAPLLWRSEFRNVLVSLHRHRDLEVRDALAAASAGEAMMEGREHRVESSRVLRLAAASGRSSYDCEFVALAEVLAVPLLTADRALIDAFSVARAPEDFVASEL